MPPPRDRWSTVLRSGPDARRNRTSRRARRRRPSRRQIPSPGERPGPSAMVGGMEVIGAYRSLRFLLWPFLAELLPRQNGYVTNDSDRGPDCLVKGMKKTLLQEKAFLNRLAS